MMIKIAPILFFLILISLAAKSQITIKIVFKNLESNAGHVLVDFRDGNDRPIKGITGAIKDKESIIIISGLLPGKYSFKYFHDANDNKKLDTNWIGIPKEGFGFSNNAKIKFGPPNFKETIFEVQSDTTIICETKYINF